MSGKRQMRLGAGELRSRVWAAHAVARSGGGCGLRWGTCRVLGAPGSSGRGPMWTSGAQQEQSSGEGASSRCGDTADPGWVSQVRQCCTSCRGKFCRASFHLVPSPPEFPAALFLFWPHALISLHAESLFPFSPIGFHSPSSFVIFLDIWWRFLKFQPDNYKV